MDFDRFHIDDAVYIIAYIYNKELYSSDILVRFIDAVYINIYREMFNFELRFKYSILYI